MPVRNKYGPHGDKDEATITENCVAFWKKRPILKLVLVWFVIDATLLSSAAVLSQPFVSSTKSAVKASVRSPRGLIGAGEAF